VSTPLENVDYNDYISNWIDFKRFGTCNLAGLQQLFFWEGISGNGAQDLPPGNRYEHHIFINL
jgi:hypothetical protein